MNDATDASPPAPAATPAPAAAAANANVSAEDARQASEADNARRAGEMLRSAREATGLHIAALAVSLKVPIKKLEALESGRIDQLPDAVFVRALASSVCRSLKLDPGPVLALLPHNVAPRLDREAGAINAPFRSPADKAAASWLEQVSRPALAAVALLAVGALILIFLPQTSRRADDSAAAKEGVPVVIAESNRSLATEPPAVSARPAAAAPAASGQEPLFPPNGASNATGMAVSDNHASASPVQPAPMPAAVASVSAPKAAATASSARPATPASAPKPAMAASAAKPALPASAPKPAMAASAPKPATVASAPRPAAAASAPQPAASAPRPVASNAVVPAGSGIIALRTSGPSWVEVVDARGTPLLRRTLEAGESVELAGTAPFALVIGRTDVTRVTVRGKPFDLQSVAKDNVARFEVK